MSSIGTRDVVAADLTGARQRRVRWQVVRLLVASDVLAVYVSTFVAAALVERSLAIADWPWVLLSTAMVPAVFAFYSLYERDRRQIAVSTLDEMRDALNALGIVGFLQLSLGFGLGWPVLLPGEPVTLLVFWLSGIALIPASRAYLRAHVIPRAVVPQTTIVVGAGRVGQSVAEKIRRHPEYNVRLVGFLDDDPQELRSSIADLPVLGSEDDLVDVIRRHRVQRVVLAFSRRTHEELLEVVRSAGLRDVHLSIIPRYFEIIAANVGVADLEGVPVLELPEAALSRFARWSKRAFDLALGGVALLLLAPLLLLIAIAIKLDSPGPVFFRQPRRGRREEAFRIFKFRTMAVGAESRRADLLGENECDGPLFKIREDPRVTRVGRILRRYSLDELPQLLNVVRGEMSLVGPRPFVVYEDEKIEGWARRRLDLTPGMTGVWQVLGRNDIGYEEMVKLDYLYVTNWSLWWDMKLVLQTIPVVLGRRGY
jgi:exopolysaccharide biosynthesis polyprenyl glycosylphosphotransferase